MSIVGKLDLVSGSSERRIVFRQIPLGIVSMGGCFVERVPRCEQLAPGIPGLGRRLAGRVVRAERPVLGVPGKGTNRLVGAAVLLLDLGDINAVRGVFSECLPAKGSTARVTYERGVALILPELGRAILDHRRSCWVGRWFP